MNYFAELKGTTFEAGNYVYKIGNFEQVDNLVDIILFKSETTEIYFRPSALAPKFGFMFSDQLQQRKMN